MVSVVCDVVIALLWWNCCTTRKWIHDPTYQQNQISVKKELMRPIDTFSVVRIDSYALQWNGTSHRINRTCCANDSRSSMRRSRPKRSASWNCFVFASIICLHSFTTSKMCADHVNVVVLMRTSCGESVAKSNSRNRCRFARFIFSSSSGSVSISVLLT